MIATTSPLNGFLVIDKALGQSSRHAVDRVLGWLPKKTHVGHTGTLDPLATGVLVLALGQATRVTDNVQQLTKVYRAGVRLGATSATDDAEGPITSWPDPILPDRAAIERLLPEFVGRVSQVPPAFSAALVKGRRSYRLARKGRAVELEPRVVRIERIDLLAFHDNLLDLEITCGKGTYIRSLARDLGARLGCGGYIASLRRTRVGPFREEDAHDPEKLSRNISPYLRPLKEAFLDTPRLTLSDTLLWRFTHGQKLEWSLVSNEPELTGEIAIFDEAGTLHAVAAIEENTRLLRPLKVFALE